jgi:ABC-type proline/glycine betaine transport system permease subunit
MPGYVVTQATRLAPQPVTMEGLRFLCVVPVGEATCAAPADAGR